MGLSILSWIKIGLVIAFFAAIWAGYAMIKHAGYKEAEAEFLPQLNVCHSSLKTAKGANEQLVKDIEDLHKTYAASQKAVQDSGQLTKDAIKVQADALLLLAGKEKELAASRAELEKITKGPKAATKEQSCEDMDRISLDYSKRMRVTP